MCWQLVSGSIGNQIHDKHYCQLLLSQRENNFKSVVLGGLNELKDFTEGGHDGEVMMFFRFSRVPILILFANLCVSCKSKSGGFTVNKGE